MKFSILSLLLLIPIATCFSVTCHFGYYSKKYFDERVYRCSIRNAFLDTPFSRIRNIHGTPKLSLEEVIYLEITEPSECRYMPVGLQDFFPNLEGIHIHKAKLRIITKENLENFPNLRVAYFNGNQLIELESNLFENNKNLKAISFRDNKIREIGEAIFDGLDDLVQIKFSNNVCLQEGGDAEGPDEIKNVREAILEHCKEQDDPDISSQLEALKKTIENLSELLLAAQVEYSVLTTPGED